MRLYTWLRGDRPPARTKVNAMKTLDPDTEPVPVYLERYATELTEWRKDVVNVRAARDVPAELNTHPKDRALFARVTTVLAQYDCSKGKELR